MAKRFYHAFLDDELDTERNIEILAHINCCETCAQCLEEEKRFRSQVLSGLSREETPPSLAKRIEAIELDDGVESPSPQAWWRRPLSMAAMVLLALTLIMTLSSDSGIPLVRVAEAAAIVHREVAPLGTVLDIQTGNAQDLSDQLQKCVDTMFCVPNMALNNLKLDGVRLTDLGGLTKKKATVICYRDKKGRRICHIDAELKVASDTPQMKPLNFTHDGVQMVLVHSGKMVCGFFGDLPAEELKQLMADFMAGMKDH